MKRFLSLFLCLCLLTMCLPAAALADDIASETNGSTDTLSDDIPKGQCGDNLTWELENGCLNLTGSGDMYNYTYDGSGEEPPWADLRDQIREVHCDNALFASIGNYAFYDCDSLNYVNMADDVPRIGAYAFQNCPSLTSILISSFTSDIGFAAFADDCNLASIIVPEDNSSFSSIDGVLFNKDQTKLICYPEGKTDTEYDIPDGVTTIGYSAFHGCSHLTAVSIPSSVTSIEFNAFQGCTGLTSVSIPNSVTSIESGTFSYCTDLTSISIPNSVTSIEDSAFDNCTGLSDVYYAGSEDQWNSIEIYDGNAPLLNATKHFNSSDPSSPTNTSPSGSGGSTVYYSLTAIAHEGGTISSKGVFSVTEFSDRYYEISPNAGYRVSRVLVDGVDVGPVTNYTFKHITANHTIEVFFSGSGTGRTNPQTGIYD